MIRKNQKKMNRLLLFAIILFVLNGCGGLKKASHPRHLLQSELHNVLSYKGFETATLGMLAVDIESGDTIIAYNSRKVLRPASTMKLFSTATALEVFGPDYRFQTELQLSGHLDTARHYFHGNLIIKGGGDPTLGSRHFSSTKENRFLKAFVKQLKKLQIDSISGRVVGDASVYGNDLMPACRSWQNMGNYFGAAASGLSVNDNTYAVLFNTGASGEKATVAAIVPSILHLTYKNEVYADSILYDNVNIFGAPFSLHRVFRGTLPAMRHRFPVKGSLPDPPLTAAALLDSALNTAGIKTGKKPSTAIRLKSKRLRVTHSYSTILTLLSPPLSEIIKKTNQESINLFAEHCMMAAGTALGAPASVQATADSVKAFWKERGMKVKGMNLCDGSGLSQYNSVAPAQLVFLLTDMKRKGRFFKTFYSSLPLAGKSGTLQDMFVGSLAEDNLRAKSGTIYKVKTYAGYITTRSGRHIAFAVMVNGFSCSSSEAKHQLEQLMKALVID